MSIEVMSLVWRADLPAMDKIVLLRLADFADAHGHNVYPSVERVQKECGVSERHARAVIKKFTIKGLLILVRQGGGRNRPTEYRFDIETLKRCTPCRVFDLSDAENPAHGAPITDQKGAHGAENPAHGAEKGAPGAPNPPVTTSNRQVVVDGVRDRTDEPAPSGTDQHDDARTVVASFHQLRSEGWPTEAKFPAPELTLLHQASTVLAKLPLATVLEVMTLETARAETDGKSAPHSLKAFGYAFDRARRTLNGGHLNGTTGYRHHSRPSDRIDPDDRRRAIFEA